MNILFLLVMGLAADSADANGINTNGGETNPLARADALRTSSDADDLDEASKIYLAALEKDPNNVKLLAKAAWALTEAVGQRTNGAIATVDGDQDSPAHRDIWRTDAKRAVDLAERAYALDPENPQVVGVWAASYGYYSTSFGVFKAITQGAAKEFTKRAKRVIEVSPELDDGLGYYMIGLFDLMAPWPVGSASDAQKYLRQALDEAPTSVRDNYINGVERMRAKKPAEAEKYLKAAISLPCHATCSERMLCTYLKRESQKILDNLNQ